MVIASTVMVADADFVESAIEVAVSVTFRSLAGGGLGAEYVTAAPLDVALGETEPHCCVEHDTVQVTPRFAESLPTVAVKFVVVSVCKVDDVGNSDTLSSGVGEPPPQPPNATSRISVPVRQNRSFVVMAALRQFGQNRVSQRSKSPAGAPPDHLKPCSCSSLKTRAATTTRLGTGIQPVAVISEQPYPFVHRRTSA